MTVLFCDIVGSTAIGEAVDAEAVRSLLARFFERIKGIVEAHGGVVDKFIGDGVMAVFGVPVVHEDDALRALRAAIAMREAVPKLGLRARVGVNTGEVVTGTAERLVTGDAVNVAARLEKAAAEGTVLLGAGTLQLVKDAVEVSPVGPLELKGKSQPVPAWELLSVRGPVERPAAAPMIGRETELARLQAALELATGSRSCQLFTIVGEAGVGKSRLVSEFLAGVEARVVRGHCLSYGEGITYWPVVAVIKQLGAIPEDDQAAAAIRSLLGETEAATSAPMIAWAVRTLLEQEAEDRPLVCVFDDLHWAEGNLLDLVEHVAEMAREAPILLLCMARPELLELRPGWGGRLANATTTVLEPLDPEESRRLLSELGRVRGAGAQVGSVEDEAVAWELQERICAAADGNPLFLEELLAFVREADGDELRLPATIRALLAARLEQLDPVDRGVLERAAVEGRVFHQGALHALSEREPDLAARLAALVRKDLIRPARAQLAGEDAYQFRHELIREAAYHALPKSVRARLHEQFARWLERRGAEMVELDEIVGYHLEQAARYKGDLGRPDTHLAERAGERLAAAGRRALWRGDTRAGARLLERSLVLTRPIRLELRQELNLAGALVLRSPQEAAAVAEAVVDRAEAAGDLTGAAVARVVAASCRTHFARNPALDELEQLAHAALALLEGGDDHDALSRVWPAFGTVANWRCRHEEGMRATRRALQHAQLAGLPLRHLNALESQLVTGPCPADEALEILDALPPDAVVLRTGMQRAVLLAMLDRFDEAHDVVSEARERWPEQPGDRSHLARIATFAGDHEAAAGHLRSFCEVLENAGQRGLLATYAPSLGRSLCLLGRHNEAEPLGQLGRDLGVAEDIATQVHWRQVLALVESSRGEHAAAEQLARDAVAIAERGDALDLQGNALCDLGQVLQTAGDNDAAGSALRQALRRYERKRNLAMARQVRERLGQSTFALNHSQTPRRSG